MWKDLKKEIFMIVFVCLILFLVLLGLMRTWELNSNYYKSTIEPWCEPKGFFGWGYKCDLIAYNEYLQQLAFYDEINFTFNISQGDNSLTDFPQTLD